MFIKMAPFPDARNMLLGDSVAQGALNLLTFFGWDIAVLQIYTAVTRLESALFPQGKQQKNIVGTRKRL